MLAHREGPRLSYLIIAGANSSDPITVGDSADIAALTGAIEGPVNVMTAALPSLAALGNFVYRE
jgi:hypothetical protein